MASVWGPRGHTRVSLWYVLWRYRVPSHIRMHRSHFWSGAIVRAITGQVTYMRSMFHSASAFNQDIGSWNTEKVTDMGGMFNSARSFNQDISSWTGTAATTAQTNMFNGATAFQAKYTCSTSGPASSCDTIESTWLAPSPPPSAATPPGPLSSSTATLTGLLGLISASVVAFALV